MYCTSVSLRMASIGVVVLTLAGCGGGNSSPASTTTPTTPTQANRSPVINSMSISPAFGIAQLTAFTYSASASDPDGDAVSYGWNIAGNAASSASGLFTFNDGGSFTGSLTVSDGKGGSASDSRTFIVGTMGGNWTGLLNGLAIKMSLEQ